MMNQSVESVRRTLDGISKHGMSSYVLELEKQISEIKAKLVTASRLDTPDTQSDFYKKQGSLTALEGVVNIIKQL